VIVRIAVAAPTIIANNLLTTLLCLLAT
jgi:hypothetical protein